jgi:hypothetical protein
VKPVSVLLPQGSIVDSIEVQTGALISLGTGFDIPIGKHKEKPSDPQGNQGEVINFDESSPYPLELFSDVQTQVFRGYTLLLMKLYPVFYQRDIGELCYYDSMTVCIQTSSTGSVALTFRGLPIDEQLMQEKVEESSMLSTYTSYPMMPTSSIVDPADSFEYVLITTSNFMNSAFQDLIDHKIARGTSATIVSVENIIINYAGVDVQEKIRNFIRDAYMGWETNYVLIGGDVDVVAIRLLWVESWQHGYIEDMPSDLYYSCLDGSYNSDGDDQWGEPNDGPDGDDVDLFAEVYVGRACVGNGNEIYNFVTKTLAYENTVDEYLKKALMIGEYLGFGGVAQWGGNMKDEMINGSDAHGYITEGIPSDSYDIDTLYDRDSPGYSWPKGDLIDRMNNDVHLMNHLGHGNWNKAMKITNSEYDSQLTNEHYFFLYSQTCLAGKLDATDCVAEHLTVKTLHGAFAVIMNARSGWGQRETTDGPSQRFDREFWDAIYGEDLRTLGAANADSKEDNVYRINEGCMRWCTYELNLFGDPQVEIKLPILPDHDVGITNLAIPPCPRADEPFDVVATVKNFGKNNETEILVDFLINDLVQETVQIAPFLKGQVEAITFTVPGLPKDFYNFSVLVYGVENDSKPENDQMSKTIFVGNEPPDTPTTPSGPSSGRPQTNYQFTTIGIDPENLTIKYLWDFNGDGTVDQTSGFMDSGEPCTQSHRWYFAGTYQIKVKTEDQFGAQSNWSNAHTIQIVNHAPNRPEEPVGPTLVRYGTTASYTSRTIDSDGDSLYYQWKWGDKTDEWIGPYNSGDTVSTTHTWSLNILDGQGTKTYIVQIRARDTYGYVSEWSPGLNVTVKGGGAVYVVLNSESLEYLTNENCVQVNFNINEQINDNDGGEGNGPFGPDN